MSGTSGTVIPASNEHQTSLAAENGSILVATSLRKAFGAQLVIKDLSLSFNRREIVLLLGSNGAGKSTLLRMLAGLARPDAGSVCFSGERCGFASHHSFMYSMLTVRENLSLMLGLLGRKGARIDEVLGEWSLMDVADKKLGELSRGYQARASLARACMGSPAVLILDEPSSNLDHQSTQFMKEKIKQVAQDGLVIVATHDIHRLGDLASRVVVIERSGGVVDSGRKASRPMLDSLIQRYQEANR